MEILYGAGRPGADTDEMQKAIGGRHTLIPFYSPLHQAITPKLAPKAKGLVLFVDSMVTERVLDQLPELKFIATQSTGTDHINLEACS